MQPDFTLCVLHSCVNNWRYTQTLIRNGQRSKYAHQLAHSVAANGLKICLCPHLFKKSEKGTKPQAYVISCFANVGQHIAFINAFL